MLESQQQREPDRATMTDDERIAVDAARILVLDAIENCGNGHPGAAMALAPLAFVLFSGELSYDPSAPDWPDRDRFVLSNGHAVALLYAALHLSGYDVTLEDLRSLRQLGSRTPAHPERGVTPGIDVTTGPLGQGLGCAVGMALEERRLRECFASGGDSPIDHRVWVIAGDGDLMEGISSEACSLAGHLGLDRLTVFYDDNRVTIDGSIDLSFSEDVGERFRAYGWEVIAVSDVNDLGQLRRACKVARLAPRPTLVIVRSTIAFGAPHAAGEAWTHGTPLGAEEAAATRENLGFADRAAFDVPELAYHLWRATASRNRRRHERWERDLTALRSEQPEMFEELSATLQPALRPGWDEGWGREVTSAMDGAEAPTRESSGRVLEHAVARVPNLVGGSADLSSTTFSLIDGEPPYSRAAATRQLHFGIREHAMAAAANGIALEGGRPFVSTFLAFSDYLRPSIRLACLMRLGVIYLFTHDSIGLAGDGPTHQPIEHLAALRAIPELVVLRPADGAETAEAWRAALGRDDGPTAIVLSRQPVPSLRVDADVVAAGVQAGAYIVFESALDGDRPLDLVLLATGSEVHLCTRAARLLEARGLRVRVVSMPSWELLRAAGESHHAELLGEGVPRLAVEAAGPLGWAEWLAGGDDVLAMSGFGCCGQGTEVLEHFGYTEENVVARALALLARG